MKTRKNKKGQTMVEYIIIVALIAIALIGAFLYFGRATHEKITGATKVLSDEEGAKSEQSLNSMDENSIKSLK